MKFAVEVGEIEKHLVEFNFNQLIGKVLIRVDEQPVYRATRLINEPINEVFEFTIGKMVKSDIRIEKQRKPLLGHRNSIYVNNRLTRVFEGL